MNIWQVAAGDGERNYWDVFRQFGVMLIGPGTVSGDYRKNKDAYNNPDNRTTYHPAMRLFADEAAEKDLVVLKRPRGTKWEAVAVGKINSGYSFEPVFSDVEGFQLQHCRHVEWKQPTRETLIRGLGRGRFSHVNNERAREAVERLWKEGKREKSDPIPHDPKKVSHDELIDSLTVKGLPGPNAKRIAKEIERLRHLAKWYEKNDENYDVREHETRTFLIVPLIMSLGWDEEKVKIEWEHKDVALFDAPYSPQSKPLVIIESKRLWDGLGYAPEQAERYAGQYKTCDRFVVSDGIRYKLFTKPKPDRKFRFSAYLNLLIPTRNHPYEPGVGGAVSFLWKMNPDC